MSVINFQMPSKVTVDHLDDNNGIFIFEPLERGYGVTIGNALRRVLISSLEGYAITSVKIPGVLHEFSTIEGVVEDVMDLMLNLKKVRFKKITDIDEDVITVSISNKKQFVASDIGDASTSFEVLNPDMPICNLAKGKSLSLELTINKGRGYVSADENKPADHTIGVMPIDSIYTPVRNVKYNVEETRVGQRIDFEKLSVEVMTDGSIDSESAMREATDILIQHFALLSTRGVNFEPLADLQEDEMMDDETLRVRKILQTPITDLNLSVRAMNCLKAASITNLGGIARLTLSEMDKVRNLGDKTKVELRKRVEEEGLELGMDIIKYKLDEDFV